MAIPVQQNHDDDDDGNDGVSGSARFLNIPEVNIPSGVTKITN